MRIEGWYIDGFGLFRDRQLRDLPAGLNLFLGPNEAGKSTLLAFVQTVLFGFPPGQKGKALYPPFSGGKHGGRLFLHTDDGAVTLERFQGVKKPTITASTGAELTESDLQSLLHGVDGALFRSVFAFSLTELSDLKALSNEGVADRIFSAGIAGAGRSAREVVKQLEKEREALLKPRAGGQINELLVTIDARRRELSDAKNRAGEYALLLEREEAAGREVESVHRDMERERAKQRRFQLLCGLWPDWREKQMAEEDLARLDPPASFPEDAEELLGRALAAFETARRSLKEREGELEAERQSLARLGDSLDDPLAHVSARVREQALGLPLQRQRLEDLPREEERLRRAEDTFREALQDLGPGWDETRVDGFDTSLPVEQEIESWESAFAEAEVRVADAEREADSAAQARASMARRRDELLAELGTMDAPDAGELEQAKASLRALRANFQEARGLEADLRADRVAIGERRRGLAAASEAPADNPLLVLLGPALLVSLLLALLAAGGAVWAAWTGSLLLALVAGAVFVILVVAAYRLKAAGSRPGRPENQAGRQAELAALRKELREAERALAAGEARLAELHSAVAGDARKLGLAEERLSFQEIEDRGARLAEEDLRLVRRQTAAEECARAEKELERAASTEIRLRETADSAAAQLEQLAGRWADWKKERGFPANLSAPGAQRFLVLTREVRKRLKEARDLSAERQRLQRMAAEWDSAARGLLQEAGVPLPGGDTPGDTVSAFMGLERACAEELQKRERHARLTESVRALSVKAKSAQQELEGAQRNLDELYASGGAQDEITFRRQMGTFAQAKRLKESIATLERGIEQRVGQGDQADKLLEELRGGEVTGWQAAADDAARRLEELEAEYQQAIEVRKEVQDERSELEISADIPRIEGELQQAETELDELIERWRSLTVTQALVKQTLGEFVKNRQPQVLLDAGKSFRQVTDGAYERVLQADDGETLMVRSGNGETKAPEQLSRGTLEQLYLCLRLGLAEEYAKRSLPVPLILDDILVNFDPQRKRRVAQILLDFAEQHQVLMLTCHPDTAVLLGGLGMRNPVIGIPDFTPRTP